MVALGEAAAVMAHEVRNPVAAIMNALVLLERDGLGGPDGVALLSIISQEATRLAQVVNQLLELGRPLHPSPCAFAVEDLIERAVSLLTARGALPKHSLEMPASRGTLAWLDPTLAELAVLNVIQNAVQSTSGGGKVRFSVEAQDGHVRCVVADDGPGIPDSIRTRLGQPFVTTRATGTGMGLAVVRRIMEASGGRILIEPGEPCGAKVALEFPRAALE
jgi:signal transduction histidine kinase